MTDHNNQAPHGLADVDNVVGGGFIIAVDGPSGTGKSTVCRRVAEAAEARYLDTGAMYRVATLHVLRAGIDVDDPTQTNAIIDATADLPLEINEDPRSTEVILDGEDVSGEIRGPQVTAAVSAVSAIPEVRENLVELQRSLATKAGRCVVEGRDIGTVVLQDAPLKVFMTASAETRAQRRYDQDVAAGRDSDFDAVLADVIRRDEADSSRAVSPLRAAEDAVLIDTTEMDIDDVVNRIAELARDSAVEAATDTEGADDDLVFRTADGTVIGDEADFTSEDSDGEFADEAASDAAGGVEWDDQAILAEDEDFPEIIDADDFDLLTADGQETDWDAVEEAFGSLGEDVAEHESLCTVAIVGRPNVGKSTLVNRFIGRREAVVEDFPGVTRDRISYLGEWSGQRFWVQDTGGWDPDAKGIHGAIARQAETAMETADVIVFVVDTKVGITSTDEVIARKLQRSTVPVILVANKFDSDNQYGDMAEFWSLGLGDPYPVSAQHGRGAADVLDLVLKSFPEEPRQTSIVSGPRRVALVGRPNVGKSSLLNKITGEERSVVDNVAGTTVDPVDSIVELEQRTWRFVDTAGIRKKTKTARGHEFYASLRTRAAIDSAEVAIFLVDASEPIAEQDQRVLRMILDSGRALVVAYNKWDLVDEDRRDLLEREIELQLAHVPWARRVNISAKTGRALQRLEPAMIEALDSWDQRISTGQLNTWLRTVIAETPPPMRGGRLPRVLFATQASTKPPVIVLFTTGFLEHGYRRFLERKLRETFGFQGSPVRVAVRVREKKQRKR
ncbi:bifunctional cytidylate kinase/GTPase Der [Corynebacterium sp. 320]|uniref:bifunctional cytidylate kinase/GTPase Der n=1 Tax=Corynebacterium TaxID=1716 RepID=UPI00125CBEFA|nr:MULTISPECIES: bifunctional cytidylate kinase/GTPase Der [Corynebacterium]KAB1503582.1 bifunctional cytidylate kinase/GTPase Der [Corynebacterium sp. 320]KAB1553317.1 bifunctional cytidylate kinase/GTPase Der [Corynebacterium sp. 321]KAB1553465.1 bifunctional cytidylate kinase/GTPase Der [Corynebacterium sp. 319]KAB3527718.1 bifunctional cytidylate kinase/GTPase Der [Corynebacterium sp. 250]KAB3540791.1 bifunctional cytidylate kinase/GTPase Der [Corynebacterium sp. 366]